MGLLESAQKVINKERRAAKERDDWAKARRTIKRPFLDDLFNEFAQVARKESFPTIRKRFIGSGLQRGKWWVIEFWGEGGQHRQGRVLVHEDGSWVVGSSDVHGFKSDPRRYEDYYTDDNLDSSFLSFGEYRDEEYFRDEVTKTIIEHLRRR